MAWNEGQGRSSVARVLSTSIPKAVRAIMSCVKRAGHSRETRVPNEGGGTVT